MSNEPALVNVSLNVFGPMSLIKAAGDIRPEEGLENADFL